MAIWSLVWTALNSNVGILILGSCLSWVFLNFVWGPWIKRKDSRERQLRFRQEVEIRLEVIREALGKYPTLWHVDGGNLAACIDPAFSTWNIYGLVFSGWGKQTYKRAFLLIGAIKVLQNEPGEVRAAQDALRQLASLLGFQE